MLLALKASLLNFYRAIINSGTQHTPNSIEHRNIRLTNFLALIISVLILLLLVLRLVVKPMGFAQYLLLAVNILVFLSFIVLNAWGRIFISRLLLCWYPFAMILINVRTLLLAGTEVETSTYVGFRLFLVAFSCFPFLLFRLNDWPKMLISLSLPFAITMFYDTFLTLMGVGYWQMGLNELSYSFNNIRTFVSFAIIGMAFLFLKSIIEKQEQENIRLIEELADKNIQIQQQANDELKQLNDQLLSNLDELTKREFFLNEAQKIAKVGSWEYNHQEQYTYWSDEMYNIFEVNKQTPLEDLNFEDTLFNDSSMVVKKTFRDLLFEKREIDASIRITTKKGNNKWIRILGFPVRAGDGVIGARGIIHDITYFKEATEQILKSQNNYRSLFEQATDAIAITDLEGNYLDVNSSMATISGYTREELLQKNAKSLFDPMHYAENPVNNTLLGNGESVEVERKIIKKDGSSSYLEVNVKLFDNDKLLAIARDITERKETANRLYKYNRELSLLNTITENAAKATDIDLLLESLCKTLTTEGEYKLAWISKASDDRKNQIVKPEMSAGAAIAYLNELNIDLSKPQHRNGPTAQALLFGKNTVVNEISHNPNYSVWKERASTYGLNSSMSICIDVPNIDRYSLNVYSESADAFDATEQTILERIVFNVANAIKTIKTTEERDKAKSDWRQVFERLNYHINNTPLAVIERDENMVITFWNKRAEELFGWTAQEALGKKSIDLLVHPDDLGNAKDLLHEINTYHKGSAFQERRSITKSGKVLHCQWYYSVLRGENQQLETVLSFVSDITAKKESNYQLNERVKELTGLYKTSQLLNDDNLNSNEIYQQITELLPMAFQYPEVCGVKLNVSGIEYYSSNYKPSEDILKKDLIANTNLLGSIELVYAEKRPSEAQGPFFTEELNLFSAIAEMLQMYIIRKQEEEELFKTQANLSASINNTEIMIWSVDHNFCLLSFNEAFRKYNLEHYNIEVYVGFSHHQVFNPQQIKKWDERYVRVLSGEILVLEESSNGIDFRFSLSPIIDKGKIMGVSIFADNVTEINQKNRELAEANKKIGELKVMALRSVMNPHFVFNVLNSIQFYIASNDRRNAINYLSTFSKLIRMVLTHSMADTISLAEELEMLKNYLELERVRFESKFDFAFEVDDDLSLEEIQIPSLLIQPYVENAILHGFTNKKEKGLLTIRIKGDEDEITFEIEDNGIGREASAKIKELQGSTHKSFGTKLTEERLKLINNNSGVVVSYTDLKANNLPQGTRVDIKVKPN